MAIKRLKVWGIFIMVSSPKVINCSPNNYVVKFGHSNENDYLLLCYNVDRLFQFVSMKNGNVFNLAFDSVDEAEEWLYKFAEVLLKNGIEPTYIP